MLLKSHSYSSLITKSWSSNLESPSTRGRAETASMERKREDQSSLLPMKDFRPRVSVDMRPSGIFFLSINY